MNPANSLSDTLFPHIPDIHLTVEKQDIRVQSSTETTPRGAGGSGEGGNDRTPAAGLSIIVCWQKRKTESTDGTPDLSNMMGREHHEH